MKKTTLCKEPVDLWLAQTKGDITWNFAIITQAAYGGSES